MSDGVMQQTIAWYSLECSCIYSFCYQGHARDIPTREGLLRVLLWSKQDIHRNPIHADPWVSSTVSHFQTFCYNFRIEVCRDPPARLSEECRHYARQGHTTNIAREVRLVDFRTVSKLRSEASMIFLFYYFFKSFNTFSHKFHFLITRSNGITWENAQKSLNLHL